MPEDNTIEGLNVNKIKPYARIDDYQPEKMSSYTTRGSWIMKSLEKKQFLLKSNKLDLVIDKNTHGKGLKKHQQIWQLTEEKHNLYQVYQADGEWWACGRFESSEVSIVRMATDFDIKSTAPSQKHRIIENIRGLLYYSRCQREMLAMEWHRLFNKNQPYYKIGDTMAESAIVVEKVSGAIRLSGGLYKKNHYPLPHRSR